MRSFLPFALVATLLGASNFAEADVISITKSATKPILDIAAQADAEDGAPTGVFKNTGAADEYTGQIWKLSTFSYVDKVTYRLASGAAGVSNAPVSVALWRAGSATANPPSTLLQTYTGTLPAGLADGDYITFDIFAALSGGGATDYYVLFVELTSSNAAYDARWAVNGPNSTYPDGQIINYNVPAVDYHAVMDDMRFYVQTQLEPEPSSFVLAVFAMVGLLLVVRRGRMS